MHRKHEEAHLIGEEEFGVTLSEEAMDDLLWSATAFGVGGKETVTRQLREAFQRIKKGETVEDIIDGAHKETAEALRPLKVTPTSVVVHREGKPLYGEGNIEVRIMDFAAGPFLAISADGDGGVSGEIYIEMDEWDKVDEAVRYLIQKAKRFEVD